MCDGKERCIKDTAVIPRGIYCYTYYYRGLVQICPYWERMPDMPKQESGYCHYLEIGDWEITDSTSLLWDMCKSCSVNLE